MEKRLIITADDFGLAESVDLGIFEALRAGTVTSVSLMATGRAFDHAASLLRGLPRAETGVHLTITDEKPVSRPDSIKSLVNGRGRFHAMFTGFLGRFLLGKIDFGQLTRELSAQVEKVRALGIPVTHINSHNHFHLLPGIFGITMDIARRYGIRCIRTTAEPVSLCRGPSRAAASLGLNFLSRVALSGSSGHGFAGMPRAYGFSCSGHMNAAYLRRICSLLPPGIWELICHPGREGEDTVDYRGWRYGWEGERGLLCDPETPALLERHGIRLRGFASIQNDNG